VPAVTRSVNVLLSMCVTACAAERNWRGLTFVPNRNRLGLGQSQNLIFIQLICYNDPATRVEREHYEVVL
jgi:hypothetical protein